MNFFYKNSQLDLLAFQKGSKVGYIKHVKLLKTALVVALASVFDFSAFFLRKPRSSSIV